MTDTPLCVNGLPRNAANTRFCAAMLSVVASSPSLTYAAMRKLLGPAACGHSADNSSAAAEDAAIRSSHVTF